MFNFELFDNVNGAYLWKLPSLIPFFHFLKLIGIAVNETMRENGDSHTLQMVLSVNICR